MPPLGAVMAVPVTRVAAPFRYWGAKVRMAPWIVDRLPAHDHYIEACAGSAAILAVKAPVAAETINDTYGEVVTFFRVLQDPAAAAQLIDRVAFTPYAHDEFRRALETSPDASELERAWAFFVRMQMAVVPGRTGWSYGVSGPSSRKANKPGRWATMPAHLQATVARFDRVQVTSWDVLDLMRRMDTPGALILVDPPYIDESRPRSVGASSGYVHDTFDHEAFIAAARGLQHASVAVTHYPHPAYDAAFFVRDDYLSHRNVPNGAGRDEKVERLYLIDRSGTS